MLLELIVILAILASLYMSWNIGANDVANSMGTSVGSGALTLRNAIIVAVVFEFLGAVLVGKHVTNTIAKGIVDPTLIPPNTLMVGMLAALIGAGLWVTIATYLRLPVSTTQSIVGAVMGFAAIINMELIHWEVVGDIAASWVVSPILGAIMAYIFFMIMRRFIFAKDDPIKEAKIVMPFFIFLTALLITMSLLFKGLKNLGLSLDLPYALSISIIVGFIAMAIGYVLLRGYKYTYEDGDKYKKLEKFFIYLQVMTAASVAFAHGANDVANSVGPLVTIVDIYNGVPVGHEVVIPIWVLMLGGFGIVIGVSTWGYKVIETIGHRITEITPTRGFAAELATAFTVLVFSKLGMPVSTSQVIVGSVMGVGFARGIATVDYRIIKNILLSWVFTIPVAMAFSAGIFLLFKYIFLG